MKNSSFDGMLLDSGNHFFLDLEDTLVTPNLSGWSSVDFINKNIAHVVSLIEKHKPDTVNVFSFAIDDDADLKKFKEECGIFLERHLGFKFTIAPHMEQIRQILSEVKGLTNLTRMDINDFWNKQLAFKDWLIWNQKRHTSLGRPLPSLKVLLLDDMVETEVFNMPHLKITGVVENPVNL